MRPAYFRYAPSARPKNTIADATPVKMLIPGEAAHQNEVMSPAVTVPPALLGFG